jgi:hypothetical protein
MFYKYCLLFQESFSLAAAKVDANGEHTKYEEAERSKVETFHIKDNTL